MAESMKIAEAFVELGVKGNVTQKLEEAKRQARQANQEFRTIAEQYGAPTTTSAGPAGVSPFAKVRESAARQTARDAFRRRVHEERMETDPSYRRQQEEKAASREKRELDRQEKSAAREKLKREREAVREKTQADREATKSTRNLAGGLQGVASALGMGRAGGVMTAGMTGGLGVGAAAGAAGLAAAGIGMFWATNRSADSNMPIAAPGLAFQRERAERDLAHAAGQAQKDFYQGMTRSQEIVAGYLKKHPTHPSTPNAFSNAVRAWMMQAAGNMGLGHLFSGDHDELARIGRNQAVNPLMGTRMQAEDLWGWVAEATLQQPIQGRGQLRIVD